jgi:hypothetical protein
MLIEEQCCTNEVTTRDSSQRGPYTFSTKQIGHALRMNIVKETTIQIEDGDSVACVLQSDI